MFRQPVPNSDAVLRSSADSETAWDYRTIWCIPHVGKLVTGEQHLFLVEKRFETWEGSNTWKGPFYVSLQSVSDEDLVNYSKHCLTMWDITPLGIKAC